MSDVSELFVRKSRALLTDDYLPKIERSLAPLTEDDVWWRPNPVSNSIGNLVLHLAGNVTQWILGGVAGRPYARTRQQEFDERTPFPKSDLLARLSSVVVEADAVIAGLDRHDARRAPADPALRRVGPRCGLPRRRALQHAHRPDHPDQQGQVGQGSGPVAAAAGIEPPRS